MEGDNERSNDVLLQPAQPDVGKRWCGYIDDREVSGISKSLLQTLCTVCVERTAGDPFSSAVAKAEECRRELLEYANKATDNFSRTAGVGSDDDNDFEVDVPSQLVGGMLSSFLAGKRTMFSQLSTRLVLGDKKEDRVNKLCGELDRMEFWPLERRNAIASILIQRVDKQNIAHCNEQFSVDDEEALVLHQGRCRFAPFLCPNPNCGQVNAVLHAEEHDSVCPKKMMECKQNCKMEVSREDMERHCATLCPMKQVPCPFKSMGCDQPLLQGDLVEHCKEWVEKHLYLTFLSHQKVTNMMADHQDRIVKVEQALAMGEQTHEIDARTIAQALKQVENKVKALEAEIKKLHKETKSVNNNYEVAQLSKEIQILQSSFKKPGPSSS